VGRYSELVARLGIIGLPNVGKTTLFNALTGLDAHTAPHPFSTASPNLGVASIPDPLLEAAAEVEHSKKIVHASLELLDLPAMSSHGGGLGSQFLGKLRDMEGSLMVLRSFQDERIPADESGTDAPAQTEELLLELTMADAEVFDRRRPRIAKEASADPAKKPAAAAIAEAADHLAGGHPLRDRDWSEADVAAFRDLAPLTLEPAVWVVNVGEDEPDRAGLLRSVEALVPDGDTVVALSAKLEAEVALLAPEDRSEILAGLGMGGGALTETVRAAYETLGLLTFYTVGPKEAHAWTVHRGATAPVAAGKIHSDLQRGFIRAEVATIEAVVEAGGWDAAKAKGVVRVEGKDYEVHERDVIVVRFSV
jgi:GTP-binding protein YchF